MKQAPLAIVGPTSPPLKAHGKGDVDSLDSIGAALERAMVSARMTHETLSERVGVSRGYLGLLISGKRQASVTVVLRAVRATGSLAPIQWVCKQVGGELYCDPTEQRKAKLRAELAELEGQ